MSVEGFQLRFTWVEEAAVAVSPVGIEGTVMSAAALVVAQDWALWLDTLPAVSYAAMV